MDHAPINQNTRIAKILVDNEWFKSRDIYRKKNVW